MKKARIYWRPGDPIVPIVGEHSESLFRLKIDHREHNECWNWMGAKDRYGYGMFKLGMHVRLSAHRLAYALAVGEPGKLHVCHSCDNPSCCNPSHLFLGTPKVNASDKVLKGRARGRFSKKVQNVPSGTVLGGS